MNIPNIDIRHGRFIDIDSPPQAFDDITFTAARVELLGTNNPLLQRFAIRGENFVMIYAVQQCHQ